MTGILIAKTEVKPKHSMRNALSTLLKPQGQIFFGWWIVASSAGVQLLSSMLWMQTYGAYVVLLGEEFGWSKTLFAGAFALARFESGILGPLQGWLVDRFGPRLILSIGTVLFGLGFMAFSQVETLIGFYATFALIALGSSLGGFATLMVSLVNWFSVHRSKAVAVSQMGYAIGGFCVPLVVFALELWGWRTTAFASGVLVLVVGLPIVQLVRHRPEEIGETADGLPLADANGTGNAVPIVNFTAKQAMQTRAFWLISFGHAFALLTVSSVMMHLIPHLTEGLGYSLQDAAFVVALLTVFQLFGQISGGYLGDRFNKRIICVLCMVGHSAGLLLLTFASHWSMVLVFAVLHGIAWGTRGPLMIALRADYFGAASFGTILGFSSLIVMLGTVSGPVIAAYMADVSGNYQSGLSLIAGLSLLGSLCFLAATPPPAPTQAAA